MAVPKTRQKRAAVCTSKSTKDVTTPTSGTSALTRAAASTTYQRRAAASTGSLTSARTYLSKRTVGTPVNIVHGFHPTLMVGILLTDSHALAQFDLLDFI